MWKVLNISSKKFWDFKPYCLECKCYAIGTKENTTCSDTGKCTCKLGYAGDKCDTCDKGYFKQSDGVCKGNNRKNNLHSKHFMFLLCLDCNCNLTGSVDKTCDANGTCTCKNRLIGGSKCDQCIATYFDFPNCQGNHL